MAHEKIRELFFSSHVGQTHITTFVELADLVNVETAFCSHGLHDAYKKALKGAIFTTPTRLNAVTSDWLHRFGVIGTNLCVSWNASLANFPSVAMYAQNLGHRVESVKFEGSDLQQAEFAAIVRMFARSSNITELSVHDCNQAAKSALMPLLDTHKKLEALEIAMDTQMNTVWLSAAAVANPRVTRLELTEVHYVSDFLIGELAPRWRCLQQFVVTNAGTLSNIALRVLATNCKGLELIKLRNCSSGLVTDEGVAQFCAMLPGLRSLHVTGAFLELEGAALLSVAHKLPDIRVLELSLITVDVPQLLGALIQKLAHLHTLLLHWGVVEAMARFQATLPPSLTSLKVEGFGSRIDADAALTFAAQLGNVRYLDLDLHTETANEVVHALCVHLTQLRSIRLSGCTFLLDATLLQLIRQNPQLEAVAVQDGQSLTNTLLLALSELLPALRSLELCDSPWIDDDGVVALVSSCTRLHTLNLAGSLSVTDASLVALAEHSRHLRSLCIETAEVSVEGLRRLGAQCRRLQLLRVSDACIDEESAAEISEGHQVGARLVIERCIGVS